MESAKTYSPSSLNEVVFANESLKVRVNAYASGGLKQDLLLWGSNGTGKSTVAKLLPYAIGGANPYIEEDFATLIKLPNLSQHLVNCHTHADLYHSSPIVFLVFHELDDDKGTMSILWKALDKLNESMRRVMVIVTTNHPMKIHQSLRSRFTDIEFPNVKALDFLPRAQHILQSEGIVMPSKQILGILSQIESYGDIRKYCNKLDEIIYLHQCGLPIPNPAGGNLKPALSVV